MKSPTKLMSVLNGNVESTPPLWLMRQAGRYLPEYKQTRKTAGSFLELCYNPDLATEVTMQPIRRFDFDAAILFSDILTIPDALDRNVRFVEGEGPRMDPLDLNSLNHVLDRKVDISSSLKPVFETVAQIRKTLSEDKTLIGFCGAPWTVATYMIAGRGTPDQGPARQFYYQNKTEFLELLNFLADISADYLASQVDHGAEVVQIFDSWSSVLDVAGFEDCCVEPVKRLISKFRERHNDVPIIGFPKGAGSLYLGYREKTACSALGLDWGVSWHLAKDLQADGPVQGNLDPMRLLIGGDALKEGVDDILENLGSGPLIFNLGHGITPNVPIDHVHDLVKMVRG